jgi:hypothetical protein
VWVAAQDLSLLAKHLFVVAIVRVAVALLA